MTSPKPPTLPHPPRHPAISAFLEAYLANDKASTARTYGVYLRHFERWLVVANVDLMRATTDQLAGYQLWFASQRSTRTGELRARTTQATVVIVMKSLYAWLRRRGQIVHDPAALLVPPSVPTSHTVRKDHLTLQETTALIQTVATLIAEHPSGTAYWALRVRNLALLSVALATGRRVQGLVDLQVDQLDFDRNELRVDREKSRTGRVLPIAPWAMATVRCYLAEARPLLLKGEDLPFLFIGQLATGMTTRAVGYVLVDAVAETIRRNPDLTDLPRKRISTHSLRVSFAIMLFQGGCNIRSLNELMLHADLSTTARYTPMQIADVRRIMLAAHPRA